MTVWLIPLLGIFGSIAVAESPKRAAEFETPLAGVSDDTGDWPMYNRDVIGTRFNPAEKTLGNQNVGQLVEKWRFPHKDSNQRIGVVHATVVVNGYVYFGTETNPTFYKLTPDGKVKWTYSDTERPVDRVKPEAPEPGLPRSGFLNAALVTRDTVYFGSVGGTIYALDRETGKERWKIDTRARPFPGAHASNCVFSSPIVADGNIVVAGGGFEHSVAADPKNTGCTGRGFVVALEPYSGAVSWKYDVGPVPKEFDQPVTVRYGLVARTFHRGPSTSSVWCTPSFDAATCTVFFGTDCHNSPRQPTPDDPRLSTKHSCAVIALDARSGAEKWVTQITENDVWNYALPAYDAKTGYKDQSIGDTPKIYTIDVDGRPTKVVGCGSKNGGFYVLEAAIGKIVHQTPIYTGPPRWPPQNLDPRTLALPSAIGGLQTGCATDGNAVYTNGIDRLGGPPTGGRVVSISLDTNREIWRHERPRVAAVGGTAEAPAFRNVGDPVASGIAVANGVAYFTTVVSNKLVALDTATGGVLKEIDLGEPVWCGPTVSRGRVYVGAGNLLFNPGNANEAYFPKSAFGAVYSFGLPGEDEVDRMKLGNE
jgi:polyvinyl alcohol dehydrogenase (cytochrome)